MMDEGDMAVETMESNGSTTASSFNLPDDGTAVVVRVGAKTRNLQGVSTFPRLHILVVKVLLPQKLLRKIQRRCKAFQTRIHSEASNFKLPRLGDRDSSTRTRRRLFQTCLSTPCTLHCSSHYDENHKMIKRLIHVLQHFVIDCLISHERCCV